MENKKHINLTTFIECKDIKEKDVLEFLNKQGYNISNFKCTDVQNEDISEYDSNHEFFFYNYDELDYTTFNCRLVLLGSPENWKNIIIFNNINENFLSTDCRNNPWVRYIYFNISEFKVFEVFQDRKHPKYLTTKLEKDLSKEWVQFLAKTKEEYKPSLIQLMIKRKQQAEQDLESSKQHVQKEKAKLDKYLEERIVSANKEIDLANTTTEWIEEIN